MCFVLKPLFQALYLEINHNYVFNIFEVLDNYSNIRQKYLSYTSCWNFFFLQTIAERNSGYWIICNCIYCSWMKYPQVSIKGCVTQKHYIPFDLFWNLKLRSCDTALDSSQYSTCWLCLSKTWFMNNLDECYLTSLTSLLCLWSVDKLKLHNHYTYP